MMRYKHWFIVVLGLLGLIGYLGCCLFVEASLVKEIEK